MLAFLSLLGLTALTAFVLEASASPALVLGIAVVKTGVIGAVFLELDRAHPGWSALAVAFVVGLAGGMVWCLP
ncbi:MAG: cytochrome C oxidase subunit IV family protein [Alphaproteobacteria bacterium]|nr:cytochrome C oxidase subunit IV family protein [Alphaproteobacteria bacterium]